MKRFRIVAPLLAGAVMACGSSDKNTSHGTESASAVAQADGTELVLMAPTIAHGLGVGNGWATGTQTPKVDLCFVGDTVDSVPTNGGSISLDHSFTRDALTTELGLDASMKAHYLTTSTEVTVKLSESARSDSFSESYVFGGTVYNKSTRTTGINWAPSQIGADAIAGGTFADTCGDKFVSEVKYGGSFWVVIRVDFQSTDDKSTFDGTASLSGSFGAFGGQVTAALDTKKAQLHGHASLHMEAFQVGGDLTQLYSLASQPAAVAGNTFIDCDLDHLQGCDTFVQNVQHYLDPLNPIGFPRQLQSGPAPMVYIVDPWPNLKISSQIPSTELTQDRALLETKFENIDQPYERIQRLLNEPLTIPDAQRKALIAMSSQLVQALGLVTSAVTACYDNMVYGQDGTPNTSNVATCTSLVGSLTVPVVPPDLIGSSAQYELDAVEANFPFSMNGAKQLLKDGYGQWEAGFNEGLYWSPDYGAFAVQAPIYAKYQSVYGTSPVSSVLGYPITSTASDGLAQYNLFVHGAVFSSKTSGTFETHGGISDKYTSIGFHTYHVGPWTLGYPKTDVMAMPGVPVTGFHQDFEGGTMYQNGAFAAKPIDGTHPVFSAIMDAYKREGYERGPIGFPASDLTPAGGTNQFVQWFERGAIYANGPSTFWVGPELQRVYFDDDEPECKTHPQVGQAAAAGCYVGGPSGHGGFPTADEIDVYSPSGILVGRRVELANNAMLMARVGTLGAETDGWFLDEWRLTGKDNSIMGYPIDHPRPSGGQAAIAPGWYQVFDGGVAYATPLNGRAYFVAHGFLEAFGSKGYEGGCLGWPVSDARTWIDTLDNGTKVTRMDQTFQHGFITRDVAVNGVTLTKPQNGESPVPMAACDSGGF